MKPVAVDAWIERNERRIIEVMARLYENGATIGNIRSYLRTINQAGNADALVRHMERKGLLKLGDNGSIQLTQKGRGYLA